MYNTTDVVYWSMTRYPAIGKMLNETFWHCFSFSHTNIQKYKDNFLTWKWNEVKFWIPMRNWTPKRLYMCSSLSPMLLTRQKYFLKCFKFKTQYSVEWGATEVWWPQLILKLHCNGNCFHFQWQRFVWPPLVGFCVWQLVIYGSLRGSHHWKHGRLPLTI